MSDGSMNIKFNIHSEVPHKMRVGGQSAKRFSQIRQNEIVKWFKKINENMKSITGEDIIIGISPIYQRRFEKFLSTYNKQKIKEFRKTEYGGLSGVYQMINKLEEKN